MSARSPDRVSRMFKAEPSSSEAARAFVELFLRNHHTSKNTVNDFLVVTSELVTNAVTYGDGTPIEVSVDPDGWGIEVIGGHAAEGSYVLSPASWTMADRDKSSGRGLGIVRLLMSDIAASIENGYVSIRCRYPQAG